MLLQVPLGQCFWKEGAAHRARAEVPGSQVTLGRTAVAGQVGGNDCSSATGGEGTVDAGMLRIRVARS